MATTLTNGGFIKKTAVLTVLLVTFCVLFFSSGCRITFQRSLTKAEAQKQVEQSNDIASSAAELYQKTLESSNQEAAVSVAVEWLKKQPGVRDVQATPKAIVYRVGSSLEVSLDTSTEQLDGS